MIEGGVATESQGRKLFLDFIVICDKCFTGKDGFATFEDASSWRKENGWAVYRSRRDSQWKCLCPKCRKK